MTTDVSLKKQPTMQWKCISYSKRHCDFAERPHSTHQNAKQRCIFCGPHTLIDRKNKDCTLGRENLSYHEPPENKK